ncbi:hypothetical protein GPA09_27050 [Burkholderia pseudomallei]|nr:hypothetical protein [Burkholderia pseudomallei]
MVCPGCRRLPHAPLGA